MAHDVLYLNPQGESFKYTFDFADDLTGDTALADIGSGSTIIAYNSASTDVSTTVLSLKTRTSLTLLVTIGALTEGEDYRIEFLGQGTTSLLKVIKVLEIRARRYVQGSS